MTMGDGDAPPGGSCRGTHRPPASETAEHHPLIRVCSVTDRALVEEAANLLHKQWPRGGSPEQYRHRCFAAPGGGGGDKSENKEEKSPRANAAGLLPCSYLLVDASSAQLIA
jgi:hypothetical protein